MDTVRRAGNSRAIFHRSIVDLDRRGTPISRGSFGKKFRERKKISAKDWSGRVNRSLRDGREEEEPWEEVMIASDKRLGRKKKYYVRESMEEAAARGEAKSIGDFERNRGGYSSSTHYSRYGAEAEVYGVDGYSP